MAYTKPNKSIVLSKRSREDYLEKYGRIAYSNYSQSTNSNKQAEKAEKKDKK
jgi:hypothetical protein